MAKKLYYIFPQNGYLNQADGDRAEALGLKDHLLADMHVGFGGAVEQSAALFEAHSNWTMGTVNLETNPSSHDMNRALKEAADLNDFFNTFFASSSGDALPRIKARTASFCTEQSDNFDGFDQGLTFFNQNQTWIQPPGYVHQMIAATQQPNALQASVNASSAAASVSAQLSDDKQTLRVILVNSQSSAVNVGVAVQQFNPAATAVLTSLAGALTDANLPSNPTHISPKTVTVAFASGQPFMVPANSVNVLVVNQEKRKRAEK